MTINSERTVIITGGTRGIGEAISRCFYEDGAYVVIGGRQDNGLAGRLGDRALFYPINVTKPPEQAAIVKTALDWTGRLDVFVNNAGFSDWRSLPSVDEGFWNRMIDTNLKGTFFGCQAAAAYLKPGGCIINISSLAGKRGSANNSVYCASKFGVNGITQSLAKELGPSGIRVNAVCPVYVRTEGLLSVLKEPDAPPQGGDVEQYLEDFTAANSALGTLPTGEDMGRVCLFLASTAAAAVTGQCINVDCGVLPQ